MTYKRSVCDELAPWAGGRARSLLCLCLAFLLGDVLALQAPDSFSLRTLRVTVVSLADNPRR